MNDGGQTFSYDATGQQASASYSGYSLIQQYDGEGLRVKKTENGATTYYLRSTVLGGQVVAEMNGSGTWTRGFVYGAHASGVLAVQQNGSVNWVHEDPVTKSKRVTDASGNIVSAIELDPWGGETNRSSNSAFQPKNFTSYHRDANHSDEAMFRRYNRWHSRFDQPDPYDGSYSLGDPQSLNRYAYTQNDPVNFVDPSGLCSWRATLNPDGSIGRTEWLTPCNVNSSGGSSGGGGRGFDSLFSDVRPTPITEFEWRYSAGRASFGDGGDVGGGGPQEPADVQRRLAEGRAWDRWQAWINCNTPIMNKYNAQLNEFHRFGGTAFSREVGAGFGVLAAGVGAGGISEFDPLPAGGGPVIGVLSAVLIAWGEIQWARATVNKIMSDYKAESEKTCGSKPPAPPGVQ